MTPEREPSTVVVASPLPPALRASGYPPLRATTRQLAIAPKACPQRPAIQYTYACRSLPRTTSAYGRPALPSMNASIRWRYRRSSRLPFHQRLERQRLRANRRSSRLPFHQRLERQRLRANRRSSRLPSQQRLERQRLRANRRSSRLPFHQRLERQCLRANRRSSRLPSQQRLERYHQKCSPPE